MTTTLDARMLWLVPVKVKTSPSIKQKVEMINVVRRKCWMGSIISYFWVRKLPADKAQVRKLKCQATWYTIINRVLFRWGYTPFLRCLYEYDADYVLREIYQGIYENHYGLKSLAFKVLRQGYFWLTMHYDT